MTKLTPYQTNVLRMLDKYITRVVRRFAAAAARQSIVKKALCLDNAYPEPRASALQNLDGLLGWLNSMPDPRKSPSPHTMRGLIYRSVEAKVKDISNIQNIVREVIVEMHHNATALEMEALLPPPRLTRRPKPASLRERRAMRVDEKVAEWERKLKVAKTKLKKYRSKQKYYRKKGAGQ